MLDIPVTLPKNIPAVPIIPAPTAIGISMPDLHFSASNNKSKHPKYVHKIIVLVYKNNNKEEGYEPSWVFFALIIIVYKYSKYLMIMSNVWGKHYK